MQEKFIFLQLKMHLRFWLLSFKASLFACSATQKRKKERWHLFALMVNERLKKLFI